MKKALFPGSFDPITVGHLNLIERAANLFDHLVIGLAIHPGKTSYLPFEKRLCILENVTKKYKNVSVLPIETTLYEKAEQQDIHYLIRGIRGAVDAEEEILRANLNQKLGKLETIFLPTRSELAPISSSLVRELLAFGKGKELVPTEVLEHL